MAALNQQLWLLQRVVLHPTYRGAGLAAAFVRLACELCDVDWIETLSAMGQANPFFEKAGFVRVGVIRKSNRPATRHGAYGASRRAPGTSHDRTYDHSEPVYYIRDNRDPARKSATRSAKDTKA